MNNTVDTETFGALRTKWQRVDQGIEVSYAELLRLDDSALLRRWNELVASDWRAATRGWYRVLYREFMSGKRVFKLGSGLGMDGIHFIKQGAEWTFADITVESLEMIRRVCAILHLTADFMVIDDELANFNSLQPGYDVAWANWSLGQLPFDLARAECLALLPQLKPRSRWIEVYYPPERFAGKPRPTLDWATSSYEQKRDWQEIYDIAKLRRRLAPAELEVILDWDYAGDNSVKWADFLVVHNGFS